MKIDATAGVALNPGYTDNATAMRPQIARKQLTIAKRLQRSLKSVAEVATTHRIGGNLKLLRESTNADRKWLKIAFSIANCRFRLPICNLKRCLMLRSALLD